MENYFDKKGNLILYGSLLNKNGEPNAKDNLRMFRDCFTQNLQSILSVELSSKPEDVIIINMLQSLRNAIYYEAEAQYSALLENEVAKMIRKNSSQNKDKSDRQSRKAIYQKQQDAITELATYWDGTEFVNPCKDLVHFNDLLILANVSEEQRSIMISKMEKLILEEKKYKHLTEEQKKTYLAAKKDKNNTQISKKVAEIDAALELLDDEEDIGIKQELNEHIVSLKNILGI